MHQLSQKRKKKRKKLHQTYLVEPIPNSIGESKPNKINPKSQQIIKKSNPKSQSKISLSQQTQSRSSRLNQLSIGLPPEHWRDVQGLQLLWCQREWQNLGAELEHDPQPPQILSKVEESIIIWLIYTRKIKKISLKLIDCN